MRGGKAFLFGVVLLAAWIAQGRDPVPVYGPAHMAVEDEDLLDTTILPLGTLAVSPGKIWKVRAGDGLTPGGIPIHPEGCVTGFVQIANATTNLNMRSYSITFGPWAMHGAANEWDLQYGTDETWLRLIRDGQAYLAYDFTIVDASHYRFQLAWTGDGYDFPVLQVATNLVDGYATVDPADVTYSRPDTSHLVIDYAIPGEYVFLSFRIFAADRLSTGAYFGVPIYADYGLQAVGSLSVTGRVESYYDEHAEETRDRYVPGSITIDGEEVATTGAVAAVAADLAAHQSASNPHGITAAGIGALTAETDSAALSALGVASNALHDAIGTNSAAILAVSNRVDTLSNTVSAIDADYLTSADAAGFATTQAVASVERRILAVERYNYWDECVLYWGTNILSNGRNYLIPTNFPTHALKIIISGGSLTNLTVRLPVWAPETEKIITLFLFFSEIDNPRSVRLEAGGGTVLYTALSSAAVSRIETLRWDGIRWSQYGTSYTGHSIAPNGARTSKNYIPEDAPSTVEEWLALHPEWASP